MIRLLSVLGLGLLASTVAQAQDASDEIHFRATVKACVPLSKFSGTVTPVHFDPYFALTMRIESAAPAETRFTAGSVVTFAIHSPSQLFAGEPTKGKAYDFVLHHETKHGKLRFFDLTLAYLAAPPSSH